MSTTCQKQERVIEVVRQGLEGDKAVSFIQQSGYAITPAAIARHLRAMGGRDKVRALIDAGRSNHEILQEFFPEEELKDVPVAKPAQSELFVGSDTVKFASKKQASFETTKLTVTVPTDLHTAIKLAARAEGKSRSDLIVEILESALSRMPRDLPPDEELKTD